MNENEKLEKYEGCVLPVVDDRMNVYMEVSYYENFGKSNETIKKRVENVWSLYEGLSDVINFGFYYSFNTRLCLRTKDGNSTNKIGHSHAHSLDEVIREVYYNPESFSIDEEDYELYSKQELLFLHRLQNFLKVAGIKDIDYDDKNSEIKRARSLRVKELLEYKQCRFKKADEVIEGKINKLIVPFVSDKFLEDTKYIVVSLDGDYKGIVNVKKEKIKFIDIDKYDIDYKMLGYESINDYIDSIKEKIGDYYDKDYVIVERYRVEEKFN